VKYQVSKYYIITVFNTTLVKFFRTNYGILIQPLFDHTTVHLMHRLCPSTGMIVSFREATTRRCAPIRSLTNHAARRLLGIDHADERIAPKELRRLYLEAAKRCHPDTAVAGKHQRTKDEVVRDFCNLTEAYELLQGNSRYYPDELDITNQEQINYRNACQHWLGIPAHIVEESKRCPMFRDWLKGETDSAERWRVFFCLHGGMAPMLPIPAALIEDSTTGSASNKCKQPVPRRRRK